jgi:hypothetical protein
MRRAIAFKDEGHIFNELKEAFKIPSETYYYWKDKLENRYYDIKIVCLLSNQLRQPLCMEITLYKKVVCGNIFEILMTNELNLYFS